MNEFYASFASFYPGQFASAKVGQLHRLLQFTSNCIVQIYKI